MQPTNSTCSYIIIFKQCGLLLCRLPMQFCMYRCSTKVYSLVTPYFSLLFFAYISRNQTLSSAWHFCQLTSRELAVRDPDASKASPLKMRSRDTKTNSHTEVPYRLDHRTYVFSSLACTRNFYNLFSEHIYPNRSSLLPLFTATHHVHILPIT
ncbi:hypothetical protein BGX38DRAFT_90215 [Terfezia claveryi]|nr:hypothetical protein BGX38DRAFT_90215 [Terfezia claveryi]